jgi:hypothetical protein
MSDDSSEFEEDFDDWEEEEESYDEGDLFDKFQRVSENDPRFANFKVDGRIHYDIDNVTVANWEQIGRDIANNNQLLDFDLRNLNLDLEIADQKITALFLGLTTRSNSIEALGLRDIGFGVNTVRSMLPYLQRQALTHLCVAGNNITSEGFMLLWNVLCDGPIELLNCDNCGIDSINILADTIPKHLTYLSLPRNPLGADGCLQIAKLLRREDATLKKMHLEDANIDDEGVAILLNALRNNTSLKELHLNQNEKISDDGKALLLKLVNDVSSINATLQSNHTLAMICVEVEEELQDYFNWLLDMVNNGEKNDPAAVIKQKIIHTQLDSQNRARMCRIQGIDSATLYSQIDPLVLPEVLALIGRTHGRGELYVAVTSSIAALVSTMNREKYLEERKAFHEAELISINSDLESIRKANSQQAEFELEGDPHGRKRPRQN